MYISYDDALFVLDLKFMSPVQQEQLNIIHKYRSTLSISCSVRWYSILCIICRLLSVFLFFFISSLNCLSLYLRFFITFVISSWIARLLNEQSTRRHYYELRKTRSWCFLRGEVFDFTWDQTHNPLHSMRERESANHFTTEAVKIDMELWYTR